MKKRLSILFIFVCLLASGVITNGGGSEEVIATEGGIAALAEEENEEQSLTSSSELEQSTNVNSLLRATSDPLKWDAYALDPVSSLLKYGMGLSYFTKEVTKEKKDFYQPSIALSFNQQDIYFDKLLSVGNNRPFLRKTMGSGLHLLKSNFDVSVAHYRFGEVLFLDARKGTDIAHDISYETVSATSSFSQTTGFGGNSYAKTDPELVTTVTLDPDVINSGVKHTYEIENTGSTLKEVPIFVMYDLNVNGENVIPVKSLGVDKGVYIDVNGYRIEYVTDTLDGPSAYNVSDWIGTSLGTLFGIDKKGNNITTSANQAPADELLTPAGSVSNNLFMYWGRRTIEPGKSIKISYDIRLQPTNNYVKVNYRDKDGNTLYPSRTIIGSVGSSFAADAASISGYLVQGKSSQSGTITTNPQEINFVYQKSGKVIVEHYYQNNSKATDDVVLEEEIGKPYTVQKDVRFSLVGITGAATQGVFSETPKTVRFIYQDSVGSIATLAVTDKDGTNKNGDSIVEGEDLKYQVTVAGNTTGLDFIDGTKFDLAIDPRLEITDPSKISLKVSETGQTISNVNYDKSTGKITGIIETVDGIAGTNTLLLEFEGVAQYDANNSNHVIREQMTGKVQFTGGPSISISSNSVSTEVTQYPKQTLTVQFKDEEDNLLSNLTYTVDNLTAGSKYNLKTDTAFAKHLKNVTNDGYIVTNRPTDEENLLIGKTGTVATYKLAGQVFIESAPTEISFASVKYDGKIKRVSAPTPVKPLVVKDTRANKTGGWELSVKMVKPLTHVDKTNVVLKNAIHYVYENIDYTIGEDFITIYNKATGGSQNISNTWGVGGNDEGLKLEINPNIQPIYIGDYAGVIHWQLNLSVP